MDCSVEASTLLDWSTLIPTLVGGGLSLAGSFGALFLSARISENRLQKQLRLEQAAKAYTAFQKLRQSAEDLINLERQIQEAFDGTDDALEPWARVRSFVGAKYVTDLVTPDETSFLIDAGEAGLTGRVHLIQRRIINHQASMEKYGELRTEFMRHIESNVDDLEQRDGVQLGAELEGKPAQMAKLRAGELNSLLGQVLDQIDKDLPEIKEVTKKFKDAAEAHFDSAFPRFGFAWEDGET